MAQAGSFEDFMKNSVLDLSSIENNREENIPQSNNISNVIVIIQLQLINSLGLHW